MEDPILAYRDPSHTAIDYEQGLRFLNASELPPSTASLASSFNRLFRAVGGYAMLWEDTLRGLVTPMSLFHRADRTEIAKLRQDAHAHWASCIKPSLIACCSMLRETKRLIEGGNQDATKPMDALYEAMASDKFEDNEDIREDIGIRKARALNVEPLDFQNFIVPAPEGGGRSPNESVLWRNRPSGRGPSHRDPPRECTYHEESSTEYDSSYFSEGSESSESAYSEVSASRRGRGPAHRRGPPHHHHGPPRRPFPRPCYGPPPLLGPLPIFGPPIVYGPPLHPGVPLHSGMPPLHGPPPHPHGPPPPHAWGLPPGPFSHGPVPSARDELVAKVYKWMDDVCEQGCKCPRHHR